MGNNIYSVKKGRRTFFSKILFWIACAGVIFAGGLNLWRFLLPGEKREKKRIYIGRVSQIGDEGKEIFLKNEKILIIKRRERLMAVSSLCTHLGCTVEWLSSEKRFRCPCHGAIFDEDGNVVSGPAPSPLKKYNLNIEDDNIYVEADW